MIVVMVVVVVVVVVYVFRVMCSEGGLTNCGNNIGRRQNSTQVLGHQSQYCFHRNIANGNYDFQSIVFEFLGNAKL